MKNQKLTPLEKERLLDQEEMIDFYYIDKESHTKILVHDKRKIKVALMEMDEYERKLKSNIREFECPYNQRTDDPVDDTEEYEYQESQFELDLEDALQEMANKMCENRENSKKIQKFFRDNISEFTQRQLMIIFLRYYLDLSIVEIGKFLSINYATVFRYLERIEEKMRSIGLK